MFSEYSGVKFLLALIIGILFGIIPFSYLFGRMRGKDLRKMGSGNIGATNLGRVCGLPFFLLGFSLDFAKGLVPVLLARMYHVPAAAAGAGAIVGHVFNPFFFGKGGKGVSTTLGVALALLPKAFGISLIVWLLVYLLTLFVSVASICVAIVLPIAAFILNEAAVLDRIFITILGLLIILAHRSNIQRLLKKTEPRTRLWRKP